MEKLVLDFVDFKEKVLDKEQMKCLVVGSLALNLLGLTETEPHDVDIEVICTEEQEEKFKMLASSQGNNFFLKEADQYSSEAEKRMDKVTWTHKPYIFKWRNTLINIWAVREFSHDNVIKLYNGVCVAPVMSVVRKKVAYKRTKDIQFVANIAKKFLNLV